MTLYVAAQFLHIVGALAMFSALGAEFAALHGATLARPARARHEGRTPREVTS